MAGTSNVQLVVTLVKQQQLLLKSNPNQPKAGE